MGVHADAMTAEVVLKVTMVQQKDQMLSIDAYWMVTYGAFESIVGHNAPARFMSMVHHRLPTSAKMITPAQALTELNALQSMKAMQFMPSSCQAQLRAIRNAVENIGNRKRADMPNDGTSAMVQMGTKMSLWLQHDVDGTSHRGKRASEIMYKELLDMETGGRMAEMTLAMLEPLNTFAWLLTPAMDEKVATWRSTVMGRNIGNNDAAAIQDSGITDAQREALVAFTG